MEKNESGEGASSGSCGGEGRCCCGSGKWVWLVLAVAVVGVLIVKNVSRPPAASPPAAVSADAPQGKALPRLVDLGATKCIPCKMMAPILEELKATYAGKMDVQFIDVWENPDAGRRYGFNVIPTQIFLDAQGKELFRHEGFFSKEDILVKWKELGVDLSVATNEVAR